MPDSATAEPSLATEARLLEVLEELKAREPIFHRPELGTSRADFEAQMADDFWEVGASGRRYSRAFVLAVLEERPAHTRIAGKPATSIAGSLAKEPTRSPTRFGTRIA